MMLLRASPASVDIVERLADSLPLFLELTVCWCRWTVKVHMSISLTFSRLLVLLLLVTLERFVTVKRLIVMGCRVGVAEFSWNSI